MRILRTRRYRRRQLESRSNRTISKPPHMLDRLAEGGNGKKRVMRTERENHAATPGEDAQRANILPPGGILDAGSEQTCGTGDHGALNAGLDSIYGVVVVVFTVGRHLR